MDSIGTNAEIVKQRRRGCPKTQVFRKFSDLLRTKSCKKASKKVFSDSFKGRFLFTRDPHGQRIPEDISIQP
jgi:hypothetical protein